MSAYREIGMAASTLRRSGSAGLARLIAVVTEYRGAILTAWYLLVLLLITHRFWDYWTTLV